MNRKHFLQLASTTTTAMLLTALDSYASPLQVLTNATSFDLKILATNWGFAGSLEEYLKKAKSAGYDGIETWWPTEAKDQQELFTLLKKYQLEVGFLCAGSDSNYEKHFAQFTSMINAAAHQQEQRPLYINCHSGRDWFSFDQNKTFIQHTIKLAAETGLKICHETHRSRILYSAPVAKQFMQAIPELRLTFDVSHWCNVHESLLQDQSETVQMALARVDHIHARIGHAEGPQVNDPRAPEWADAVETHFKWWDDIVLQKKKAGQRLTILTEFGPPHYMPTVPYTNQPLADQWGINEHMLNVLRKRYGA